MADNTTLPATGTGTADIVVATDKIGGVDFERVKVDWGADGTAQDADTATGKGLPVQIMPGTLGGLSTNHLVAAGTTNATNVKASPGQVYAVTVFNVAAAPRYVKLHDTAGTPTAGSGVVRTLSLQAGVSMHWAWAQGVTFATGIAFTTVTGIADNDSAAVTAGDLVIDVSYK